MGRIPKVQKQKALEEVKTDGSFDMEIGASTNNNKLLESVNNMQTSPSPEDQNDTPVQQNATREQNMNVEQETPIHANVLPTHRQINRHNGKHSTGYLSSLFPC